MRINVDRLCELAGVPGARRTRNGLLRESRYDEGDHGHMNEEDEMPSQLASALPDINEEESEKEEGLHYEEDEKEEGMHYEEDEKEEGMEGDDQMLEIDEADLVKELRRMRVKMHESRKIARRRQQKLQETQLKAIIDQEVKSVLKELNLNSGWMYGKKKPTRSKKGYTHQGSFLKGLGFK